MKIECNLELLHYALENDIIDLAYVQEKVKMNKRREYLSKHPFKIWEGKDGKWRTYLPDKTVGRRLVKRSSKTEIEGAVVKFYQADEEKTVPVTFAEMYIRWKEVQAKLVSDNSIAKYNTDYRRYFAAAKFSQMEVTKITEESIKVFICETIKSQKLCKKASKTLFGYVKNVMNSAVINLGGNVLCVGSRPDGSPFKIGLQKPYATHTETVAALDITDMSVVSSGVYERHFIKDGVNYHHILDPSTGYPYENGLIQVSIISTLSVDGDGLSTTCFALGLEKGMELIESMDGIYAVFMTEDGTLHYTQGAEGFLAPDSAAR
mgnify:CR=1 FL=1